MYGVRGKHIQRNWYETSTNVHLSSQSNDNISVKETKNFFVVAFVKTVILENS